MSLMTFDELDYKMVVRSTACSEDSEHEIGGRVRLKKFD